MQRTDRLKPYRNETNLWILVTDPDDYSYDDLEFDTNTSWGGVSDYLSLKHMRDMGQGDLVLVCHSGTQQAIVGLARVTSDPYPAPGQNDPAQVAIDIEPVERLESPVPMAELEDDPEFRDFELLSTPELCIAPVPAPLWDKIQEKSHAHLAGITQGEDLP